MKLATILLVELIAVSSLAGFDRWGNGRRDRDRDGDRRRVYHCALSVAGFTFTGDAYSRSEAAEDAFDSCRNNARRVGRESECYGGSMRYSSW